MGMDRFTSKQKSWLSGIYWTMAVLFFLNLAFASRNVIKYVYPKQEKSMLIILFYVLVGISMTTQMLVMCDLALSPNESPFLYDEKGLNFFDFIETVGSSATLGLGWLVAATMYQLTTSIRVIYGME